MVALGDSDSSDIFFFRHFNYESNVWAQFQRPFWQLAVLATTQWLPEAELASQTKNQLIEHIELRAPSNFQVLTPKIEASSSNGLALANCTVFAAKTPTNWLV